jgi:hypothetical protein
MAVPSITRQCWIYIFRQAAKPIEFCDQAEC